MSFSDMMNIGLMQGFAGLSLFAVLLLMGLGLAIIFGQMGVINMAHGEFMTIGAYTIYLGSTLTAQHAPEFMGADPPPLQAAAGHAAGHLGREPGAAAVLSHLHRPQGSQPHPA